MFMHWLGAGLTAALLTGEPAKQAAAPKQDARMTCPYLQPQGNQKKAPQIDACVFQDDVLIRMKQLIQARKWYEEAEGFRKDGLALDAMLLYLDVINLCPAGSRLADMAFTRVKEMGKAKAVAGLTPEGTLTPELEVFLPTETTGGATQEPEAPRKMLERAPASPKSEVSCPYLRERPKQKKDAPLDPSHLEEDTLKEMTRLLKAREMFDEAEALRKTAGNGQPSEPAHEESRDRAPGSETDEGSEPGSDEEQALVPHLPPIDTKIVDALEKVLAGCSEPLAAKLIVLEVKQSTPEDQEAYDGQWPVGIPPVEIPSLLLESEDIDLSVRAEEEEEVESVTAGAMAAQDLNQVLREVVDCVRQGACVDIDRGREDDLRAQIETRVGGVDFKLVYDSSGIHCAVVRLLPEACPDLGARQRAENELIIDWISRWSGSGDYSTPSKKPDEDWLDLQWEDDEDLGVES